MTGRRLVRMSHGPPAHAAPSSSHVKDSDRDGKSDRTDKAPLDSDQEVARPRFGRVANRTRRAHPAECDSFAGSDGGACRDVRAGGDGRCAQIALLSQAAMAPQLLHLFMGRGSPWNGDPSMAATLVKAVKVNVSGGRGGSHASLKGHLSFVCRPSPCSRLPVDDGRVGRPQHRRLHHYHPGEGQALRRASLKSLRAVSVATADGTSAPCRGIVPTVADRARAEEITRQVKGVRSVMNGLQIEKK